MRQRLAMSISITALLVAVLGSTPFGRAAYSAVLPRGSVGTLQLKRNAVTSSKIAPNAIRTGQVVDGSLLTADFKPGQIPQGPRGDKGPKGDKGPTGDPGVSGYELVTQTFTGSTNEDAFAVYCPTGKRVFGGGVYSSGWSSVSGPYISSSAPNPAGTAWFATVGTVNGNNVNLSLTAYAICGTVAS